MEGHIKVIPVALVDFNLKGFSMRNAILGRNSTTTPVAVDQAVAKAVSRRAVTARSLLVPGQSMEDL